MNVIGKPVTWTAFTILEDKSVAELNKEENILVLAPFSKTPKIDFGQLKPGATKPIERKLIIQNTQTFEANLTITCHDLEINHMRISIPSMDSVHLMIKWKPDKEGSYSHAILFEVTNAARLKFIVHAFGVCLQAAKKARKPLVQFQPKVAATATAPAKIAPPLKSCLNPSEL